MRSSNLCQVRPGYYPRFYLIPFFLLFLSCHGGSSRSIDVGDVKKTDTSFVEEDFVAYSGILADSAEDYLKLEEAKMTRSFASEGEELYKNLPPQVDLSSELPEAGTQGKQNSCTGWALAFSVKSLQEKREQGWALTDLHLFSPSFIYNQINGGKDGGADLTDAMDFLMTHGTVPLRLMPYSDKDFRAEPDETLKNVGLSFRALGYRRLNEKDLLQIKAYLAANEPVLLVIEMYENFLKKGMRRSGGLYREKVGDLLGHHALVAVGYDDAKKGVKLLNSWGSAWAERGYGWIDYGFFPKVVARAYVIYDRPTPGSTTTALSEFERTGNFAFSAPVKSAPIAAAEEKKTTAPTLKSGFAGGETDDRLLVVPNEAGITAGGRWLRLGDPIAHFSKFISETHFGDGIEVEPGLLVKDTIGKIRFSSTTPLEVATNEGIALEMTRDDVHRIYQKPDFVDESSRRDTYFYHALSEKWGGLNVTKNASLTFFYDEPGKVESIVLESVFKKALTGQGFEKTGKDEKKEGTRGIEIHSPDGKLGFVVPTRFSEVNKSVWEGLGYGYFIKDPQDMVDFIGVKAFFTEGEVTPTMLQERITADLKTFSLDGRQLTDKKVAGIGWKFVAPEGSSLRLYGAKGSTIYQIQITSGTGYEGVAWVDDFLRSLEIR